MIKISFYFLFGSFCFFLLKFEVSVLASCLILVLGLLHCLFLLHLFLQERLKAKMVTIKYLETIIVFSSDGNLPKSAVKANKAIWMLSIRTTGMKEHLTNKEKTAKIIFEYIIFSPYLYSVLWIISKLINEGRLSLYFLVKSSNKLLNP